MTTHELARELLKGPDVPVEVNVLTQQGGELYRDNAPVERVDYTDKAGVIHHVPGY